MILKTFDNGWGDRWPAKHLEQELLTHYLAPMYKDDQHNVVINNVWYNKEYHACVLDWLDHNQVDRLILVSMLDPAIIDESWYPSHNEIYKVGYYTGKDEIDYWAVFASKFVKPVSMFDVNDIRYPFMCLNRKPHWHRRRLYRHLEFHGLLDKGLVSMGGYQSATRSLGDHTINEMAPNGGSEHHGIPNDISSLGDCTRWNSHFLNIVTETVHDIKGTNFVSEKIYKPIIGERPFLVYASDGAKDWLQSRGFETYLEDFRDISDRDLSLPDNIPEFLVELDAQGPLYWRSKILALREKIKYNSNRFCEYTQSIGNKITKGISCQI